MCPCTDLTSAETEILLGFVMSQVNKTVAWHTEYQPYLYMRHANIR